MYVTNQNENTACVFNFYLGFISLSHYHLSVIISKIPFDDWDTHFIVAQLPVNHFHNSLPHCRDNFTGRDPAVP